MSPVEELGHYSIDQLQKTRKVPIDVVKDKEELSDSFSRTIIGHVLQANRDKRGLTIIMPVGPTGQWKKLLNVAKQKSIDLSNLAIIQMDEYLSQDGSGRLDANDPFSFVGFVRDNFATEAAHTCGFKKENWIVPDPRDPDAVARTIERRGAVDVAFAGIGLNGHIAFNEPPEPGTADTNESFAVSPTRVVRVSQFTKATNSIFGTGGDLGRVPDFAVTIGMKQILEAKSVHVFLDWHWQRYVLRRALMGPVGRDFPASYLQKHENVRFTITEEVAMVHPLKPE